MGVYCFSRDHVLGIPLHPGEILRIEFMGSTGAGQATKAVNQVMVTGINQAVSEALAFAEHLELPLAKVIWVLGSSAMGNWFLSHREPTNGKG